MPTVIECNSHKRWKMLPNLFLRIRFFQIPFFLQFYGCFHLQKIALSMAALGFLIYGLLNDFKLILHKTNHDRLRQVLGPIINKTLKNPWV